MVILGVCLTSQAGLVAHYSFDDASSVTNDSSGNGNDLAVFSGYGTPGYTADGKFGGGTTFDGATQGWVANDDMYPQGSFSFAAWILPTASTNKMIATMSTIDSGFNVFIDQYSGRFKGGTYYANYAVDLIAPVNTPTLDEWQHIAMTYDVTSGPTVDVTGMYTGTLKMYLNGVLIGTKTDARYYAVTTADMFIGRRTTSAFAGSMDEIRVYDTTLTPAEVRLLVDPSGLIAHYSFDDASSVTNDSSGNGNDLTVFSGYGTPGFTAAGKFGGGTTFDGSTQGWISTDDMYPQGSFSFAAWILPTAGTNKMIATMSTINSGFNVYIDQYSGRFKGGTYYANYTADSVTPTNTPALDEWQHIAMTYEVTSGPTVDESGMYTGDLKMYLNGELIGTKTDARYYAVTTADMFIGRRATSAFTGSMDEIRVYSITLTQVDIQALMLPGATFGDWADSHGLVGGDADRNADPDGDGMKNLLEYALGGNPMVDDSAVIQPSLNSESGGLVYVYNRRIDAAARGLDYGVLLRDDLMSGSWTNIGTSAETGSSTIDMEFQAVSNTVSTVAGEGYVSLEVVES